MLFFKVFFAIFVRLVFSQTDVLGLCVRAGNRSTKVDIITKVQLKNYCWILHFSPPDAKPLLMRSVFYALPLMFNFE
jgi:hypothetical protein